MNQPLITPWRPWEAIPVALGAMSASILVAVILAAAGAGVGGTALLVAGVAQQAGFLGFSLAWVSFRHRQGAAALGLRSARATRDLALGAWSGAGLFAVILFLVAPVVVRLWTLVLGSPPPPIEQPIVPVDPSVAQIVIGVIAAVIAAPLGEEVFFRGFLFGSLRGRMGFGRAAAISAAAFAIFHITPLLVVLMFFVGLALAWLYERRRSLVATIGAHAMFNVIGYTLILMDRT